MSQPPPPPLPPENHYHPPTTWGEAPAYIPPPQVPSWPKVLGIIAIAIGGYGLLTNLVSLVSAKFIEKVTASSMASIGMSPDVMTKMQRFNMVNATGCLVLAVLLIAGGIALVRRRPIARPLMISWAVLRLLLLAVVAPMMLDYTQSLMSSMSASMTAGGAAPLRTSTAPGPASPPAVPPVSASPLPSSPLRSGPPAGPAAAVVSEFAGAMAMVGVIFSMVMVGLLPGFVLIWFNLRKVKAYTATWPLDPARESLGSNL